MKKIALTAVAVAAMVTTSATWQKVLKGNTSLLVQFVPPHLHRPYIASVLLLYHIPLFHVK
jgi:hypothetical protein